MNIHAKSCIYTFVYILIYMYIYTGTKFSTALRDTFNQLDYSGAKSVVPYNLVGTLRSNHPQFAETGQGIYLYIYVYTYTYIYIHIPTILLVHYVQIIHNLLKLAKVYIYIYIYVYIFVYI
jgi:hypothetical protein